MEEICNDFTEGDLCYNGSINIWRCEEKYKALPEYNEKLYSLSCVNSTTSDCKNCRDCEKSKIVILLFLQILLSLQTIQDVFFFRMYPET